ncbi:MULTISPECIES: GntR family transcriptional regulator [Rhodococcus]|uniref:GntR family transcriptional regulator n=1 Tax=Rhodococcus TaxID=1827 RepID=UPI00228659EB|nr:GntR family transcriptional regulator [Rhodococcus sp. JS3073]WAM19698.1 GntR family transcriptional regulator [Rhodococcus sp. JS3073]
MTVDARAHGARNANRQQGLPEQVASYVRERIFSGEVKPGEFLRMEPICEAVGVSNTPVREGMQLLRSEGFVQMVPRRGFIVASFTRRDIRDLFWAQAQLAGELAARAAASISSEQLARLDQIMAENKEAVAAGNSQRITDLGHEFHRQINLAADSHRLALLLGSVVKHLPNRFYATIEQQVDATVNEHPQLVEALRTRNTRAARSLMKKHIATTADHLIAKLEEQGMWSDDTAK